MLKRNEASCSSVPSVGHFLDCFWGKRKESPSWKQPQPLSQPEPQNKAFKAVSSQNITWNPMKCVIAFFFYKWACPTHLRSVSASTAIICVWGSMIDGCARPSGSQGDVCPSSYCMCGRVGGDRESQNYPVLNVHHHLGRACVLPLLILRRTQ